MRSVPGTVPTRERPRNVRGVSLLRRMALLAASAPFLLIADTKPAYPSQCSDYHHPIRSLERAEEDLKASVLHIKSVMKSERKEGTAFLIDKTHGLFLTALHVVQARDGTLSAEITGLFEEPDPKPITLSVKAHDDNLDVALLETAEISRLADKAEFELSFKHTQKGTKVGFLGSTYSEEDRTNIDLSTADRIDFQSGTKRIEIMTSVGDGDSGAPVFKADDGLVVAIVVEKQTSRKALAMPMMELYRFLKKQSVSHVPDRLKPLVDDPTQRTEDALHFAFRAKGNGVNSNYQLLGATLNIWQQGRGKLLPASIKGCDIFYVGDNRELGQLAGIMQQMGATREQASRSTRQAAQEVFKLAAAAYQQGNRDTAATLYASAEELFADAIEERLRSEDGGGYFAAFVDGSGFTRDEAMSLTAYRKEYVGGEGQAAQGGIEIVGWFDSVNSLNFDVEPTVEMMATAVKKDSMAALFHEYQTARLKAAELSPRGVSSLTAQQNFITAAWGSQVSNSKRYRALHYQAMGDALFELDRYDDAAEAYAASWQNGMVTATIKQNYSYAKTKSGATQTATGMDLIYEIGTAAVPDSKALRRLVTDIGGTY